MKIFILSVSESIYSTNRIYQEATNHGHDVHIINHTKCTLKLGSGTREVIYGGRNIINEPDVIIPRIGASVTADGAAVVREFEMNGVYTTASSQGILTAQNKLRTLQVMNQHNIPIPDTIFSVNTENIDEQIQLLGGVPVIIKLQEGTHGSGVILAETEKSAKSMMDTLFTMQSSFILQEFIQESNSEDIRVLVVGDKVISAMKRKGMEDDFRSNIHRGGSGSKVMLTKAEEQIAIHAARYLGLPIAGVDLIRSNRGPLLIEVNSTPGLQGIEAYTAINVAKGMVKYMERKCSKRGFKIRK